MKITITPDNPDDQEKADLLTKALQGQLDFMIDHLDLMKYVNATVANPLCEHYTSSYKCDLDQQVICHQWTDYQYCHTFKEHCK